jgi:uncharacterized protein (TIGR03083 family)
MDYIAALDSEVAAMAAALKAADPSAPVPACAGWTVRELAGHVTAVHRWALAALSRLTPPPYDESPTDGDLAAAYATAGQALVAGLRDVPADHPCWTFDQSNRTASFWPRRQLHEVAVHRWDVAPYTLSDQVAEDGIGEVLEFWLVRQVGLGRTTLPTSTLRLASADRTWDLGEGDPVQTVKGSASDLQLSLWGRGDLIPSPWREATLTP